jgi:hypothetical protein
MTAAFLSRESNRHSLGVFEPESSFGFRWGRESVSLNN